MLNPNKGIPTYLIVTGLGTVLNLIRNVLVANLLGPYVTGLCHTLLVIPQLGQYFNLGLNESRLVFAAKNEGEGKKDKVYEVNNTVFNFTIFLCSGSISINSCIRANGDRNSWLTSSKSWCLLSRRILISEIN